MQRNIMGSIMTVHRGLRLCVVVDEDIDIWEPEDVMWAIESRVSPRRDIVVYNEYGCGQAFQPSELKTGQISVADGGLAQRPFSTTSAPRQLAISSPSIFQSTTKQLSTTKPSKPAPMMKTMTSVNYSVLRERSVRSCPKLSAQPTSQILTLPNPQSATAQLSAMRSLPLPSLRSLLRFCQTGI
jgi:hypothetical protein